ncbi:hypothetical protein C2S51_016162 [Perilla frutescens var. frutescens]|nr:hypothetical protein C2S51_016162 [Perilla frutescens var. frutescens]
MLANAASCSSTSAEEVVPPSARGTRAARTPQKGRQAISQPSSRRALRDELDPTEPGLRPRPPTEDAPEHTADPIDRESPPRACRRKRSRRDRSQSSGEPSESFLQRVVDVVMPRPELSDRSTAHRAPTLPLGRAPQPTVVQEGTSTSAPRHGGFSTTYQLINGIDDSSLQIAYSRFRLQGPDAVVQLYFNGDRLRGTMVVRQWWLIPVYMRPSSEHGRSFILLTLNAEGHTRTMTTSGGYLQRDWYIGSRAVMGGIRWHERGAIVVCDVADEHGIVVCIHFSDWVVELYDSLLYQMDDPSDRVHYERRDRELMPLLRLLPRLLICAGFWEGRQMPSRCAFAMTLDKFIPN